MSLESLGNPVVPQPPPLETVEECIECKWTVPNLRRLISDAKNHKDCSLTSFGRLPFAIGAKSVTPRNDWPLRAEASLHYYQHSHKIGATFSLRDIPLPPLCSINASVEFIKIFGHERGNTVVTDVNISKQVVVWNVQAFSYKLFHANLIEQMVDLEGSLNMQFKLQLTITRPKEPLEPPSTTFFPEVQENFEELLKDSSRADFQITVTGKEGGKSFQVHKAILAARSPMFRGMLESDMRESRENVVVVDDISPKAMQHFITFLYCGRFQHSSWKKSLLELVYAAEKYQVKSLKTLCDCHLIEIVTTENAVSLGRLAERYKLQKALHDIKNFIAENMGEITFDSYEESSDDE